MKNMRRSLLSLILAAIVVLVWPATALAATNPGLLTAGDFAVLAGTSITNTGPSWITGAIGAGAAGIAAGSFPPGTAGPQHVNDGVYTQAQTDLTNAYANAVQPCTTDYTGVNLGGLTLVPGVYCQTTAPTLTGTLTLNGSGIYIFLIGTTAAPTTLVTANSASVVLINGAQPCQIFWRVTSSATIAPSTAFEGTIMANIAIAMQTGATLFGEPSPEPPPLRWTPTASSSRPDAATSARLTSVRQSGTYCRPRWEFPLSCYGRFRGCS